MSAGVDSFIMFQVIDVIKVYMKNMHRKCQIILCFRRTWKINLMTSQRTVLK